MPNPSTARRFAAIAVIALLAATACARQVQVGTGPGPIHSVEVQNTFDEDMIVSYDDGSGPRTLGTVRAGATQQFSITAPASPSVRISARNAEGTTSAGPFTVQLGEAATPTVTLR